MPSSTGGVRNMLIKRILEESGLTRAQLARDAGLSEDALWAWVVGRHVPRVDSFQKLAHGLDRRSDKLQALAEEIRSNL